VALGVELAQHFWLELMLDFRYVNYKFKGDVLFGDERTGGPSGGALVGLSWRF